VQNHKYRENYQQGDTEAGTSWIATVWVLNVPPKAHLLAWFPRVTMLGSDGT
jgi:hypothetical protein